MSFEDWTRIAKGLRSAYTSDRFLPDADAIKFWYEMLKDLPYEQVSMNAQKYIATEHFPPTPADLRKVTVDGDDWTEGWEEITRALKNYGSWDIQGALDSMSERTRKLVKRFGGFERICELEYGEMDVLRANFRDSWNMIQKRETEELQLPPHVKERLAARAQQLLEGGA